MTTKNSSMIGMLKANKIWFLFFLTLYFKFKDDLKKAFKLL